MTEIKSIATELELCQKAWAENLNTKAAWCCHHSVLFEPLTEPAQNRINYILSNKPENEQAARLHNFRPVRIELPEKYHKAYADYNKAYADYNKAYADYNKAYADYNKAYADYNKAYAEWDKVRAESKDELTLLHNQDWPDNSWNGKNIFPS